MSTSLMQLWSLHTTKFEAEAQKILGKGEYERLHALNNSRQFMIDEIRKKLTTDEAKKVKEFH